MTAINSLGHRHIMGYLWSEKIIGTMSGYIEFTIKNYYT
jgi:hypothetical protein